MKILDRLPFYAQERSISVPSGGYQTIQPLLVVVWVSVKVRDRTFGPIPAFLDPGHNHNFSISVDQFQSWLGISPESLEISGRIRIREQQDFLRRADVLLHRNEPGTETIIPNNPFSLGIDRDRGIAIQKQNPWKLPLLGIRSIVRNNLRYIIDSKHKSVTLRTAYFWE